jgi:hypothetical protein
MIRYLFDSDQNLEDCASSASSDQTSALHPESTCQRNEEEGELKIRKELEEENYRRVEVAICTDHSEEAETCIHSKDL